MDNGQEKSLDGRWNFGTFQESSMKKFECKLEATREVPFERPPLARKEKG
ncbi:hypothetical protein SESBI_37854 [Sesbania bispinosa]|nr:hypothetical protein SESBI_37854 [Sesbania bispinosa]